MANEMVVGGLFDGLFKIGFDRSKIDVSKLDAGVASILDGIEPAVSSPGNLDAMVFNALKDLLHNALAELKPAGPLVVGAKKKHSREEVEAAIIAEGGDPKQFAPFLLLLLQFAPMLVELIRKLMAK